MKYLEMFTGIAGFSKGIEQAYERRNDNLGRITGSPNATDGQHFANIDGGDGTGRRSNTSLKCIGFAEIGPIPSAILKYHYPNVRNYGDATGIVCDELPDFDFLCGGFPCQSFSIAGKRQGFNEARGTVFFEIARILSHKRPRHFLLENVRGLLSSDDGKVYTTILRILADLDYRVETIVLNSKDHGVPQNRERVFFIGHLASECRGEILSFGDGNGTTYAPGSIEPISGTISTKNQSGQCNFDGSTTLILGKDGKQKQNDGYASTLTAGGHSGGNHSDMDLIQAISTKQQGGPKYSESRAFCLGANDYKEPQSVQLADRRIRRLTPTECMRLQGLDDNWCDFGMFQNKHGEWNVREISDTGKYQCAGNAVTVNVIEAIITRMLEKGCLN